MAVILFYHLFPTANANAFEKYWTIVYLYRSLSFGKLQNDLAQQLSLLRRENCTPDQCYKNTVLRISCREEPLACGHCSPVCTWLFGECNPRLQSRWTVTLTVTAFRIHSSSSTTGTHCRVCSVSQHILPISSSFPKDGGARLLPPQLQSQTGSRALPEARAFWHSIKNREHAGWGRERKELWGPPHGAARTRATHASPRKCTVVHILSRLNLLKLKNKTKDPGCDNNVVRQLM